MNRAYDFLRSSAQAPNTTKVKVAICAVAVLALLYVIFVQGAQKVSAERGPRAAEGIELTSEQAVEMSQTANDVSTLIEDASDVTASPPPMAENTPSSIGAPVSGVTQTKSIPPAVVTPLTVRPEAWYVSRAQNLVDRWGPRYAAAKADIDRFEHRFRTSEDRLIEYFSEQGALTESINDPILRAEWQRRDDEERASYARWTEEGWQLLARALEMRRALDDMDVVIRKQQLSVNMLSEYTRVSTIPASAASLYASLDDFRRQSDELSADLSTHVFN